MSEIKISDNLLSWVFGCKCEFSIVNNLNSKLIFKCDENLKYHGEHVEFYNEGIYLALNLHTFIDLAKIKAFECGYEVIQNAKDIHVLYRKNKKDKLYTKVTFIRYKLAKDSFKIEGIIEALEYVVAKVGDNNALL